MKIINEATTFKILTPKMVKDFKNSYQDSYDTEVFIEKLQNEIVKSLKSNIAEYKKATKKMIARTKEILSLYSKDFKNIKEIENAGTIIDELDYQKLFFDIFGEINEQDILL